jgi:hypothetical protein
MMVSLEPYPEARFALAQVMRRRLGLAPSHPVVFAEPSEIVEDR